jgi:copper chaperone CopZ
MPESPFADLPMPPARPRSKGRWLAYGLAALVLLSVTGAALAYVALTPAEPDPNAPRVELEVTGMHCPLQCGLRVASALETLPWVLPRSVQANPKTGIVTIAVTTPDSVDEQQLSRAIEQAGFALRAVRTRATLTLATDGEK